MEKETAGSEVLILQEKLAKALADADYWRLSFDKMLKHVEHESQYIRHLEKQLWGGIRF